MEEYWNELERKYGDEAIFHLPCPVCGKDELDKRIADEIGHQELFCKACGAIVARCL